MFGLRTSQPNEPDELRATLAEHLEELRGRIFRCAIAYLIGTAIGWVVYPKLYIALDAAVQKAVKDSGVPVRWEFLGGAPAPFMLHFKMSMYVGLVLALPYMVWQLWLFIRPGLRESERKPLRRVVPISLVLFGIGAFLGWFILGPTIQWFLSFAAETRYGIVQDPYELLLFGLKMMLAFGIAFQMPLLVYFLARAGIVSPDFLWRYWRQSTVAVFTVSAIITPSGDPVSMLAMAIPLSVLFFGSVAAAKLSFARGDRVAELDDLD